MRNRPCSGATGGQRQRPARVHLRKSSAQGMAGRVENYPTDFLTANAASGTRCHIANPPPPPPPARTTCCCIQAARCHVWPLPRDNAVKHRRCCFVHEGVPVHNSFEKPHAIQTCNRNTGGTTGGPEKASAHAHDTVQLLHACCCQHRPPGGLTARRRKLADICVRPSCWGEGQDRQEQACILAISALYLASTQLSPRG